MVNYVKAAIALLASTHIVSAVYFDPIANYKPYTDVTAELKQDLEQKEFQALIAGKTEDALATGKTYYDSSILSKLPSDKTSFRVIGDDSPLKQFQDYYGDDADLTEWVTAALTGTATNFANGNADFSLYPRTAADLVGREECAKKGSSYVVLYLQTFQKIEEAIRLLVDSNDCESGCADAVRAWDQAAAYFAGSAEGLDGGNVGGPGTGGEYGYFPYALGDRRGANYRTLGDNADSIDRSEPSAANIEMMRLFNIGGYTIGAGLSLTTKLVARRMASISAIPQIQGFLRYAYKVGVDGKAFDKEQSEGAAFAAGVLPRINSCSPEAAGIVYENMRVGAPSTDHALVKSAVECVYECIGITCADVGGLFNEDDGVYYPNQDPSSNCVLTSDIGACVGALTSASVDDD